MSYPSNERSVPAVEVAENNGLPLWKTVRLWTHLDHEKLPDAKPLHVDPWRSPT